MCEVMTMQREEGQKEGVGGERDGNRVMGNDTAAERDSVMEGVGPTVGLDVEHFLNEWQEGGVGITASTMHVSSRQRIFDLHLGSSSRTAQPVSTLSPVASPSPILASPLPPLSPISPSFTFQSENQVLTARATRRAVAPPHAAAPVAAHAGGAVAAIAAATGNGGAAALQPGRVTPGCHPEASLRCRSHGCRGKLQQQERGNLQRGTGAGGYSHAGTQRDVVTACGMGSVAVQQQQQQMQSSIEPGDRDREAGGERWQFRKQAVSDSRDCKVHAGTRGPFLLQSSRSDPYSPPSGRRSMVPGREDWQAGSEGDYNAAVPAAGSDLLSALHPVHSQKAALLPIANGISSVESRSHDSMRAVISDYNPGVLGVSGSFCSGAISHTPGMDGKVHMDGVKWRYRAVEHPWMAGKRPRGINGSNGDIPFSVMKE